MAVKAVEPEMRGKKMFIYTAWHQIVNFAAAASQRVALKELLYIFIKLVAAAAEGNWVRVIKSVCLLTKNFFYIF